MSDIMERFAAGLVTFAVTRARELHGSRREMRRQLDDLIRER